MLAKGADSPLVSVVKKIVDSAMVSEFIQTSYKNLLKKVQLLY